MVLDTRTVGPIHTARHTTGRWICTHDAVDRLFRTGIGSLGRPKPSPGIKVVEAAGHARHSGRLKAEYHQDFRDSKFDNKTLRLVGGTLPRSWSLPKRDGLRIRMPAGRNNPAAVGVVPPALRIRGDFEITATFITILGGRHNRIRGYGVAATLWGRNRYAHRGGGDHRAGHHSRRGRAIHLDPEFPGPKRTASMTCGRACQIPIGQTCEWNG